MDTLQEIWNSVTERFRNPLFFAFTASWTIANYKFIVVLSSDAKFEDKIYYIETALYPANSSHLPQLFCWPLLGAIIYVFVLPFISLTSTWVTSLCERMHNDIKINMLQKATLTVEQADTFKRECYRLVEKAQKEAQEAKTTNLDSSRETQENARKLYMAFEPFLLKGVEKASRSWSDDRERPSPGRTVNGSPEQEAFVKEHGIPSLWAKLVLNMQGKSGISAAEASILLNIKESECLEILVGLSAVGILHYHWIDGGPFFAVGNGSWTDKLNGRPA